MKKSKVPSTLMYSSFSFSLEKKLSKASNMKRYYDLKLLMGFSRFKSDFILN